MKKDVYKAVVDCVLETLKDWEAHERQEIKDILSIRYNIDYQGAANKVIRRKAMKIPTRILSTGRGRFSYQKHRSLRLTPLGVLYFRRA